jgi:HD superfamily phosphohydrolase
MTIDDPIYGRFEIDEAVIIDLLQDPTVLRLKTIKQGGTTADINGYQEYSRFDHSVGAMLLVRHLGADIDEQVAALLHDISHTAFSHIIDFVYKKGNEQNYHENIKEDLVANSNIPTILKKYGLDVERVLNEHNFSLLERPQPDLCADRVDYGLRCMFFYLKKNQEVKNYFNAFINYNGEIIFNNKELAVAFAYDFLKMDQTVLTNLKNLTAYYIMADAISRALSKEYIQESDFMLSDDELFSKLQRIKDTEIVHLLSLIKEDLYVEVDEKNYKYVMKTKVRVINPKFLEKGEIKSVFGEDPKLHEEIKKYSEKMTKPIYAKIIE